MPRSDKQTEQRFVRTDDPSLSAESNAQLTGELRQVVGHDAVRVPAEQRDSTHDRHGGHPRLVANVVGTRIGYVLPAAAALVIAVAVLALVTGSIALVVVALVVLAVTLALVIRTVMHVAGEMEHPSPELAARLEQEGVRDPDALLDELVQELTPPGTKAERQQPPPDR